MNIRFNSDDDLTLNKTLQFYDMVIFVRAVFYEGSKYYPGFFFNECLHKLAVGVLIIGFIFSS